MSIFCFRYNVDMYFAGDMHTYERSFPVYEDVFEDYHDLYRYINPNKTVSAKVPLTIKRKHFALTTK